MSTTELTVDELRKFVQDPTIMQKRILEYVDAASNGDVVIVDPTNSFIFLMESAAVMAAGAVNECKAVIRKKYPSLSLNAVDLQHHLSDNEIENMFAVPAVGKFALYVNSIDLRQYGNRVEDADYVDTIIPMYTEIIISDVTFTTLNDILIRIYDSGSVTVQQYTNSSLDIALNDVGVLENEIQTDAEGIKWVVFYVNVKQVTRYVLNTTIDTVSKFVKQVTIANKYFYSNVMYKNNNTNNSYIVMNKSVNYEYIDPTTPTCNISINNKLIEYQIPATYTISGLVTSGNISIETYDTNGYIYLPLNKYALSDFTIVIGPSTNIASATAKNIAILASSPTVVDGGNNGYTITELRESIINNTTGKMDTPVTFNNLVSKGSYNGYEIMNVLDVITDRVFAAAKPLPSLGDGGLGVSLINARPDVFFNTTKLVIGEYTDHPSVYISDNVFILKSNSIFKEDNGVVTLLSASELTAFKSYSTPTLIDYLKNNNIFVTPYYYIVDKTDGVISTNIYDLDNPTGGSLVIVGKNIGVDPRANSNTIDIISTDSGYTIYVSVITNSVFEDYVSYDKLYGQLNLKLAGSEQIVSIAGVWDWERQLLVFNLVTNKYVNDEDGTMDLTNGLSSVSTKYIDLESIATLYIYSDSRQILNTNANTQIADPRLYLRNEILVASDTTYVTVFSKENFTLTLGSKLNYIWNKMYNAYTSSKYLTYTIDIPALYTSNVVATDESGFECVTLPDGSKTINLTYAHNIGDNILDENGDITYLHRKGDAILDSSGNPIIDTTNGIVRYIDIMMFEYHYYAATDQAHINYIDLMRSTILSWITDQMEELNTNVLENTSVVYKSNKTANSVSIVSNNTTHTIPYYVSPTVVIYTRALSYTSQQLSDMASIIGNIIHGYVDKTNISLIDIRSDIMAKLNSDVIGVKISGLDTDEDAEIISVTYVANRLSMKKRLVLTSDNKTIVEYDISLIIKSIPK